MAVIILYDEPKGIACFYDNTTLTAFGLGIADNLGLQGSEIAAIALAKIQPVDVRGLNEQELNACIQGVEEWIMAQIRNGYTDPDDLEKMARTGDKPCRECGEWFTPEGIELLCNECMRHADWLDAAERKGDLEREEA